jgi:hypothetical protein
LQVSEGERIANDSSPPICAKFDSHSSQSPFALVCTKWCD